jgi:hypothetical protein
MSVMKTCSTLMTVLVLGVAVPAFAQAPAPAPAAAPEGAIPGTPMVAASDDMTGAWGFGVGVEAGDSLIVPNGTLFVKYWMADDLAVMPKLTLGIFKSKAGDVSSDTGWDFSPQVLGLYQPWKSTTTRLSVGAGLGISLSKNLAGYTSSDTHVGFSIPIYAGVEHFFNRWFSMSIGMAENFFEYNKVGDAYDLAIGVNTLAFQGLLTFYTD